MNPDTNAHDRTVGRTHDRAALILPDTSAEQNDVILVPRSILLRLLNHILEGDRRFPTRHLVQAMKMLHHILGNHDDGFGPPHTAPTAAGEQ